MRTYLVRGIVILCLLTGIGGVRASAQSDSDEIIVADIPYDFVVRDQTLPAGRYTIKVSDDTNLNVLVLRSANGRRSALFQTQDIQADQTPRQTELTFNKIGDTYFLSQIWLAGSDQGVALEKSKAEQKLEDGGMKSERHAVSAVHRSSKKAKKAEAKDQL